MSELSGEIAQGALWVPGPPKDAFDGHAVIVCSCEGGAYIGARKAGTVDCCEVCGFITPAQLAAIQRAAADGIAKPALWAALAEVWEDEPTAAEWELAGVMASRAIEFFKAVHAPLKLPGQPGGGA